MQDLVPLDRRVLDRARLSHDPRFDGRFFVAVTTTGIYCRPVCPAPSPKSANVRYYPTAAAAAEAGFRPCLRCRPEAAPGTPAWLGTSAVVRRALRLIQEGALDESSIDEFAARVGIGARHLHRLFVRHIGASPIAVAQTRRLHFAKRLLDETRLSMTQIALAAGFGSLRRFNDAFRKAYARPPREIRRQYQAVSRTSSAGALRGAGSNLTASDEIVLRLAYRPPYDWSFVSDFLAARALPGVERVDDRGYARTLALANGHATVRVQPLPSRNELELSVRGAPAAALFQISVAARRVFDLAADPALTAHAFKADPILGPLARRRPGIRIPGIWDPFECAVRAVLGQQVSVAAGRTLAARVVQRAGHVLPDGREGLTHVFPSPEALARADLDGIGVTGARIAAIRTLARAVTEGQLDFSAPADEVTAALVALPGIGAWTAQYIALRALGEPDAFPAADIALRRMAAEGGKSLTPRALGEQAEAWRPWRSYAVMHLWRAAGEQAH
jgi:AraC family transcriptional regulator, regulatory protein of adaptative response / DNA-3-methyladenine glycosylase II